MLVAHGDRIRSLRIARGWTQYDLAGACDTATRTIQRAESGRGVSIETLRAIAGALSVDFSELVAPATAKPDSEAKLAEARGIIKRCSEERQQREELVTTLAGYWESLTSGDPLSEGDRKKLARWSATFSPTEIVSGMETCEEQYAYYSSDGSCTLDSAEHAFRMIPRVCRVNRRAELKPEERELYLARGFARNRIPDFDDVEGMRLLRNAYAAGVSIDSLRGLIVTSRDWEGFQEALSNQLRPPLQIGDEVISDPGLTAPAKQLSPTDAAIALLQHGLNNGRVVITIDFEQHVFYFGRSRDGSGKMYGIVQPWTVGELADAIKHNFKFLS
jgi:transcriptional regulator with XRE-family HTH domain